MEINAYNETQQLGAIGKWAVNVNGRSQVWPQHVVPNWKKLWVIL